MVMDIHLVSLRQSGLTGDDNPTCEKRTDCIGLMILEDFRQIVAEDVIGGHGVLYSPQGLREVIGRDC